MKMDWNKASARLRKIADKHVREGQREFSDDAEMLEMYDADAHDLRRIANLLDRQAIRQARGKVGLLDTAVRDLIPPRIYDALYDEER
jgi:hypothetical protein